MILELARGVVLFLSLIVGPILAFTTPLATHSPWPTTTTTTTRSRLAFTHPTTSSHSSSFVRRREAVRMSAWGGEGNQLMVAAANQYPPAVQSIVNQIQSTKDPIVLRDSIEKLSELGELEDLSFEPQAVKALLNDIRAVRDRSPEIWSPQDEYFTSLVQRKVDPFFVIEVAPWLKIAPYVGGLGYIASLVVQRVAPNLFGVAYFSTVAILVLPIIALILTA